MTLENFVQHAGEYVLQKLADNFAEKKHAPGKYFFQALADSLKIERHQERLDQLKPILMNRTLPHQMRVYAEQEYVQKIQQLDTLIGGPHVATKYVAWINKHFTSRKS